MKLKTITGHEIEERIKSYGLNYAIEERNKKYIEVDEMIKRLKLLWGIVGIQNLIKELEAKK